MVYESGNLSAVARALSCTQSAVSQHIKRLERETGLPLIERQPRGVAPTPAGRILYQAALGGIASLDAALRRLGELRDGHGGTVSVADWDTAVLLAELGIGHAILPGRAIPPGSPVRTVPTPALEPLTVGWAARQWDALSPPAQDSPNSSPQRLRQSRASVRRYPLQTWVVGHAR
jgi:DNA-binding transcriptional LysR family regulator